MSAPIWWCPSCEEYEATRACPLDEAGQVRGVESFEVEALNLLREILRVLAEKEPKP